MTVAEVMVKVMAAVARIALHFNHNPYPSRIVGFFSCREACASLRYTLRGDLRLAFDFIRMTLSLDDEGLSSRSLPILLSLSSTSEKTYHSLLPTTLLDSTLFHDLLSRHHLEESTLLALLFPHTDFVRSSRHRI